VFPHAPTLVKRSTPGADAVIDSISDPGTTLSLRDCEELAVA